MVHVVKHVLITENHIVSAIVTGPITLAAILEK